MKTTSRKFWISTISIIAALIIIGTAWWTKGTEYKNAWFYVFLVWLVIFITFRSCCKKSKDRE